MTDWSKAGLLGVSDEADKYMDDLISNEVFGSKNKHSIMQLGISIAIEKLLDPSENKLNTSNLRSQSIANFTAIAEIIKSKYQSKYDVIDETNISRIMSALADAGIHYIIENNIIKDSKIIDVDKILPFIDE